MKLWLLRPAPARAKNDNPWAPEYNKAFGFVIRAETESAARQIAQTDSGYESAGEHLGKKTANTNTPWLDPEYSTCTELLTDGVQGVILKDFYES